MKEMLPLQEESGVSLRTSNNSPAYRSRAGSAAHCLLTRATAIQQLAGKPGGAAEHHAHVALFDNKQPKTYVMRAKPSSQG